MDRDELKELGVFKNFLNLLSENVDYYEFVGYFNFSSVQKLSHTVS